MGIEEAEPHEVVVKKLGGDAVEALQPGLETTMEAIHVLNMVDVAHASLFAGVKDNVVDASIPCKSLPCAVSI